MELEQLVVPKEKIEEELRAFKQIIKTNRKQILTEVHRDLHRIYGHLRHNGKIIDVYKSFKKAGLNQNGNPRLAIARADGKECYCYKRDDGGAVFGICRFKWNVNYDSYMPRKAYGEIMLPKGTYQFPTNEYGHVTEPEIKTPIPIIPASILTHLRYTLKNYHIIWEVEKWARVPPKDPILVKMVTPNIALVLATWELTELERAVIMGRL